MAGRTIHDTLGPDGAAAVPLRTASGGARRRLLDFVLHRAPARSPDGPVRARVRPGAPSVNQRRTIRIIRGLLTTTALAATHGCRWSICGSNPPRRAPAPCREPYRQRSIGEIAVTAASLRGPPGAGPAEHRHRLRAHHRQRQSECHAPRASLHDPARLRARRLLAQPDARRPDRPRRPPRSPWPLPGGTEAPAGLSNVANDRP